jgi:hypothetical protein
LGEQALSDLWIQELDEVLTANQRDRVLNAVWAIRRNDPTLWQDIKDAHAERRAALASPEAR